VGGYFGGRLLEAGRDVTFLVRPARAALLARAGLRISSSAGNAHLPHPPTVEPGHIGETFDLVILSCKAYDLDSAIDALAPAVGPGSAVLPLLNGMRHLDRLDERLGRERVLGGQCAIGATVNDAGEIVHLNNIHSISFGERDGARTPRVDAIAALMDGARFDGRASDTILLDMWEKWVFLASLAGITCLMRAAIGDIVRAPDGTDLVMGLLNECRAIAAAAGYLPRQESWQRSVGMLTAAGSPLTASMLRDMERGAAVEADHIVGDLLVRAGSHPTPLLRVVYTHLKAYEARRARG
jgi:2-dehydropantoate 2-reductase